MAPWILLFTPLAMAAAILFVGMRSKVASAALAIGGALVTCVISWWLFAQPGDLAATTIDWINLGAILGPNAPVDFTVSIGLGVDALAKSMLVIVCTIAPLVFIYSLGYMAHEEGYCRYFAGLSLFLFSMLGIVLADNFVMMFIFWELVGVSSYILIGHYFTRDSAAEAAKQAFTVNRIGDFGFMLGILMFWLSTGTFVFADLTAENAPALAALGASPFWLATACVLVFCGTIGKSAQMPLHVWLPNSMEGPTPVSSLLHAATMVAAGVYLLARMFPVLETSPGALAVIGWIGGITCFAAGLMGIQQNDIKRILAYSTISQLGYMVLGIAVAPLAGVAMFHLFTHAFFKCLLFLCAGSVILGMHHKQDIWEMGGLKNKMPVTFLTMCIGGLALMGFPPFSGYFSKDLIIEFAYEAGWPWFLLALGGVFLTAMYTTRLLVVVFFGGPRSEEAKKAHESPKVMLFSLVMLAIPAVIAGFPFVQKNFFTIDHPHEMPDWVPWLILAVLAVGILATLALYRGGPKKDPVLIPLFANRLYIDALYARIVRWVQDGTAGGLGFFDRWFIDGICVTFGSKCMLALGFALRFLQVGNLQAYAFFFGAGVIVLLYFLVAR